MSERLRADLAAAQTRLSQLDNESVRRLTQDTLQMTSGQARELLHFAQELLGQAEDGLAYLDNRFRVADRGPALTVMIAELEANSVAALSRAQAFATRIMRDVEPALRQARSGIAGSPEVADARWRDVEVLVQQQAVADVERSAAATEQKADHLRELQKLSASHGNVIGSDGGKVGGVGQFYLDDTTGEPTWVTAKTGLFGTSESFVPLEGASIQGGDVRVAYAKAQIKNAPRVDDDGKLSPEEEDRLYSHYGLYGSGNTDTTGTYETTGASVVADGGADYDRTDQSGRTLGRDTSGPTTDDTMTLYEERLNVGTTEDVRIEREPIINANVGNATSGPSVNQEEHEVTLHEEGPVVEKTAVPVERVRLDKETVTEQQTATDQVHREAVEQSGVPGMTGRHFE